MTQSSSAAPRVPARRHAPFGATDALLLLGALFWGMNFPIAKQVIPVLGPVPFSTLRYLFAGVLLLGVLRAGRTPLAMPARHVPFLLVLGIFGVTLFQWFWAAGLLRTSASNAGILAGTASIFGALLASFTGHRPSALAWGGILVACLGAFLVINNSFTALGYDLGHWWGDLLCVLAQVMWGCYSVLGMRMIARYGPLKVSTYAMLLGSLVLLPFAVPRLLAQDWALMTPRLWWLFAYTVVCSGAGSFLFWYVGIARIGIARTLPYAYLIPVVAVASSVLLLGERVTLPQVAGGAMILAGIRLTRGG